MGAYKVEDNQKISFDNIYKLADDKLYQAKKVQGSYLSY